MGSPTASSPRAASPPPAKSLSALAWLLLAVGIPALYAIPFVLRGWIPHDEGTIALSAERVLQGEVPHRDFDEGYTGGLSYLHAAAFRVGGVRLATLRWVLYAGFVAFLAAVFGIARALGPPPSAVLLTFLAAVWSVPNYFASLPSWYNLFAATAASWALLRSLEGRPRHWTFVAGLAAGTSVLVKQVGLYAVAAGLLFLVYREQRESSARPGPARGRLAFLAAKLFGGAVFCGAVAWVFGRRGDVMDLLEFVAPPVLWTCFLIRDELAHGGGRSRERFGRLAAEAAPFLAGVLLPVLVFAAGMSAAGSGWRLFEDFFVRSIDPTRQAQLAILRPADLLPAAALLLVAAVDAIASRRGRTRSVDATLALLCGAGLVLAFDPDVYRTIWNAARSLPLVATLLGVALLSRPAGGGAEDRRRSRAFLLVTMAALVGLVQFPFPSPIYFCYVAPLAALAVAALVRVETGAGRRSAAILAVFFLLFAAIWMNRGYVFRLGRSFSPYVARTPLDLPRAGIRVPEADAREYETLVRAVEARAPRGAIYAGPDCPEVYFLAARPNPTRSFFDYQGDRFGRPGPLLRLLDERGIAAVVLNRAPAFSPPFEAGIVQALHARFAASEDIGRFTLFWRPAPGAAPVYNPQPR